MSDAPTIFALATPTGRSGVAVVRVSGTKAKESFRALAGEDVSIKPRNPVLRRLYDPVSRETLDEALVLYFEGPASYTGEDILEYHLHGSPAVIKSVLQCLERCEGHRMAEPGEFTRRAFENGKLDLTRAEAVADLIDAQTQAQKIQALAQMGGVLSRLYNDWAERLKRMLAHLEADLEFPDEDMPDGVIPELLPELSLLINEMQAHLNDNRRGERLRDGIHVAVIGAPNAGKSSLVNKLAQRDVVIVSDMAGTTRDVVEVHMDIDGYPVILADTAGLRPGQISQSGQDAIEQEGIRRALERAQNADIKMLVFDATISEPDAHTVALHDKSSLCVVNKCDQTMLLNLQEDKVKVSAQTGEGFADLLDALSCKIQNLVGLQETPSLTRQRHRSALEECHQALLRSSGAQYPELMAEDMRLAIRSLGRITGRVDVEDLLDVIFRDFCIGK